MPLPDFPCEFQIWPANIVCSPEPPRKVSKCTVDLAPGRYRIVMATPGFRREELTVTLAGPGVTVHRVELALSEPERISVGGSAGERVLGRTPATIEGRIVKRKRVLIGPSFVKFIPLRETSPNFETEVGAEGRFKTTIFAGDYVVLVHDGESPLLMKRVGFAGSQTITLDLDSP